MTECLLLLVSARPNYIIDSANQCAGVRMCEFEGVWPAAILSSLKTSLKVFSMSLIL